MTTEKQVPKVYDVDGVQCRGIVAGVCMVPLALFAAMTAAKRYKNDVMAKEFLAEMFGEHFSDAVSEFQNTLLDADRQNEIVAEFLSCKEGDGRKNRTSSKAKISTLEAEIERLRRVVAAQEAAAMVTHISPPAH